MGVFLPEPDEAWKKHHVYVRKETVHRTHKRVYGSFKLSDGSTTKWTFKKGTYWYDHNEKHPENVPITRNRIKQIVEELSVPNPFKGLPDLILGPASSGQEGTDDVQGRTEDVAQDPSSAETG